MESRQLVVANPEGYGRTQRRKILQGRTVTPKTKHLFEADLYATLYSIMNKRALWFQTMILHLCRPTLVNMFVIVAGRGVNESQRWSDRHRADMVPQLSLARHLH